MQSSYNADVKGHLWFILDKHKVRWCIHAILVFGRLRQGPMSSRPAWLPSRFDVVNTLPSEQCVALSIGTRETVALWPCISARLSNKAQVQFHDAEEMETNGFTEWHSEQCLSERQRSLVWSLTSRPSLIHYCFSHSLGFLLVVLIIWTKHQARCLMLLV